MTTSGDPITYWQSLALAVDQGDLYLNPEVAHACCVACDTFVEKLKQHRLKAFTLANVHGLGEFQSGKELQRIFSEKAAGGANNLVDVLQSHIDVVEQMRVVFQKLIADTESQDRDNAAGLGGVGAN